MVLDHDIAERLRIHIAADVQDLVAIVLEEHLHDVLPDIVDVALDGAERDRALRRHGVLRLRCLDCIESCLCCLS